MENMLMDDVDAEAAGERAWEPRYGRSSRAAVTTPSPPCFWRERAP